MSVLTFILGGVALGVVLQILLVRVLTFSIIFYIIIGIILVSLVYILYLFIVLLIFKNKPKNQYLRNTLKNLALLVIDFMGIKLTNIFQDELKKDDALMIVGNHQSYFDIVCMFATISYNPFFAVGKDSLYHIPIVKQIMNSTNTVPIIRDNPRSSFQAIKEAIKRVKAGQSVLIYPEGTRTRDPKGKLLDFKPGAFKICKECQTDIMIVVTYNNYKKNPFFFAKEKKQVVQKYLKRIDYASIKDLSTREISDLVYNIISKELEKGYENC